MIRKKNDPTVFISHIVFILLSLSTVIPLILLIVISFTSQQSIVDLGYTFFPNKFDLSGYKYLLDNGRILLHSYKTTIIVTVVGTLLGTTVMTMLAYTLSRPNYKYRTIVSFFIFIPMMFHAGIVPSYIVNTTVYGLKDNILVLILPSLVSCWNVVLLRTFFQDLPYEVIESGVIDGANEFTIFYKLAVPMAKSGIVTIALLTMLSFWNQWTPSMIYITKAENQTLQYYLYRLVSSSELLREEALQMGLSLKDIPSDIVKYCAAIVVMGPTLMVFPFFQKYFVRGLNSGAVKG